MPTEPPPVSPGSHPRRRRRCALERPGAALLGAALLAGCYSSHVDEAASRWIDDGLSDADRVSFPGHDRAAGRVIPFLRGFSQDHPSGHWNAGRTTSALGDVYVACVWGDPACPLDSFGRIAWEGLLGEPVLAHLPMDDDFSHWLRLWVLRAPPDRRGHLPRDAEGVLRVAEGAATRLEAAWVEEGQAVVHLLPVLRGTRVEHEGEAMPDGLDVIAAVPRRTGWHDGRRVELLDFTFLEGAFAGAMPTNAIHVLARLCTSDDAPAFCRSPGAPATWLVSESSLGQDLTGDGDTEDTNNVIDALPCAPGARRTYSPLAVLYEVTVRPGARVALVDTYRDDRRSDVASTLALERAVADGLLAEPAPAGIILDCPTPVPRGFTPGACAR